MRLTLAELEARVGERNWIQRRQSLMIQCIYFLGTLMSSASAE
jgi:hypothetical protein